MRTDCVVLDASCVGKLMLDEPESTEVRTWLLSMTQAGTEFCAPHLLQYELGNILVREFPGSLERGRMLEDALAILALAEVDPPAPFREAGLTYYDAAYVSLAAEKGALATYDTKMARAADVRQSGHAIAVWDAVRIRAATHPGFRSWLVAYPGSNAGVQRLAREAADDAFIEARTTFIGVWVYLRDVRRAQGNRMEALDAAFEEFAQGLSRQKNVQADPPSPA